MKFVASGRCSINTPFCRLHLLTETLFLSTLSGSTFLVCEDPRVGYWAVRTCKFCPVWRYLEGPSRDELTWDARGDMGKSFLKKPVSFKLQNKNGGGRGEVSQVGLCCWLSHSVLPARPRVLRKGGCGTHTEQGQWDRPRGAPTTWRHCLLPDNGGSKGSESDTVASLLPKTFPVSSPFLCGGLEGSALPFPDCFALDLIVAHYSFVQWNSLVSLRYSLGFSPQKLNDVEHILWASSFLTQKKVFLKMCSAGYQFHWRSQKKKKSVRDK